MRIGILSQKQSLYSTMRLVAAAKERNHDVMVIDPLKCYMNITAGKPSIHFKEHALENFDAIIPRIGASITFYGTAVLRQFEMMGVFPVNESVAVTRSRDKLRSFQLLAKRGVDLPVTGFAHSTRMTSELIKLVGGAPLIIKLVEGTQGKGVVLAETDKAAASVIDAMRELDAFVLVQQYIKEALGSDIRCFVIGNKVVAAMQRTAHESDFRSNVHRGGKVEAIQITPKERKIAVKAAKIMGLNVSGVDIIRSKRGPLVLEVNSSPGLEGIEKACKKNIAGLIIRYIEQTAHFGKTKTRGKG